MKTHIPTSRSFSQDVFLNWLLTAGLVCGFAQSGNAAISVTLTSQTYVGFNFSNLSVIAPDGVVGTLTSVTVNATLDASTGDTYAEDLTVYIDPAPLSLGGLLQIGGFTNTEAAERQSWANGSSSIVGTTLTDTKTLATPLVFSGSVTDPVIWIGNGYDGGGNTGTWTGTIIFNGIDAVPESSSLLLSGIAGLSVGFRRRRPV